MTHQNIIDKLIIICPGAHWNLRGNTYEGLEWLDDLSTKPTAEELGL
jgi:hypothetical protein